MGTLIKCMLISFLIVVAFVFPLILISQEADAASGSISIAPGETKFINLGYATEDSLLYWGLSPSLGWGWYYWIQNPSGTQFSFEDLINGYWADEVGNWSMGFNNFITQTISIQYTIFNVIPKISIDSPSDNSYVNSLNVTISGSIDSYAHNVAVSINGLEDKTAERNYNNWSTNISLLEGENRIYAKATFFWGDWAFTYYDLIYVYTDFVNPDLEIISPLQDARLRGGDVTINFECSDDSGISKREIKVDASNWQTILGNSTTIFIATGEHTIHIRITDLAGNQVTKTKTFSVDSDVFGFGGPYYGLPTIAIILTIVLALAFFILRMRKKKRMASEIHSSEELPIKTEGLIEEKHAK